MRTNKQRRLLYQWVLEAQHKLQQNHPVEGEVGHSRQVEVVEVVRPGEVQTVAEGHIPTRRLHTALVPGVIPSVVVGQRLASSHVPDARQPKGHQLALLHEPLGLPQVL